MSSRRRGKTNAHAKRARQERALARLQVQMPVSAEHDSYIEGQTRVLTEKLARGRVYS